MNDSSPCASTRHSRRILGEVGDLRVVPDLARELHGGPACMEAAADAMWAIFMRVKSPGCQEPFYEGCHLMNDRRVIVC